MRLALAAAVILVLAGCGEPRSSARIGGDAGGVPVTVSAIYDREALAAIAQGAGFTRTVVVERDAWPDPFWPHQRYPRHRLSGYHHHAWAGSGYAYEPGTTLSLLIGDGPAEAQLLRARLAPGTSSWTLPMRPGRVAVVSLQADGGREGWRELGRFTAAAGMRVTVHLAGAQPRIEVTPAASAAHDQEQPASAGAQAAPGSTGEQPPSGPTEAEGNPTHHTQATAPTPQRTTTAVPPAAYPPSATQATPAPASAPSGPSESPTSSPGMP